jgi:hypothetical protein
MINWRIAFMQIKKRLIKIFKWLHIHRLPIVIFLFSIVMPIALVLSIYLGSHIGNKRVYFDLEKTEETEIISDFLEIQDVEHFNLFVTWESLKKPVLDESNVLSGGYYTFRIRYESQPNVNMSNVMVTPVLQTPWTNIRYLGQPIQMQEQDRIMLINFNHELPINPLWFVTVNDPILYMKITYTRTIIGQTTVEEVVYVRMTLNDLNPNQVIVN